MIEVKIVEDKKGFFDAVRIREKVFIEEQGYTNEFDEFDYKSLHAVGYINNQPIATARIIIKDQVGKIGRVAVLKEHRKKGYGKEICHKLLAVAKEMKIKSFTLSAQIDKTNFYESLGFRKIGNPYLEDGTEHIEMVMNI